MSSGPFSLGPYVQSSPFNPAWEHLYLGKGVDEGIVIPGDYVMRLVSYSVELMGLVSGNNLNTWQSEPPPTAQVVQSTSASQPTLIEDDVVKQSTLADMPTFDYDKIVTQDTAGDQPTLVDTGGGVLGVDFSSNKSLNNFTAPSTTDWSMEFNFEASIGTFLNDYILYLFNEIYVTADDLSQVIFSHTNIVGNVKLVLVKTGNNLECFVNDVSRGTKDVTGKTYESHTSIKATSYIYNMRAWDVAVVDPTNPTETPYYELLSDAQYMRKTDGTQPSVGDSIQGWRSTDAVLAVKFDTSDSLLNITDNVPEYPWTISFEMDFESSNVNNNFLLYYNNFNAIRIRNNELNVRFDGGGAINLSYGETITRARHKWVLTYDGVDLRLYLNDTFRSQGTPTGTFSSNYRLGALLEDQSLYNFAIYGSVVADPTNITEDPIIELLPDAQYIRDAANATASLGDSISAWQSTTHNKYTNVVRFDDVDDNMTSLPTTTGDFAMQFKKKANNLGPTTVNAFAPSVATLDGSNYFTAPNSSAFNFTSSDFTISFIADIVNTGSGRQVIQFGYDIDGNTRAWNIYINSSNQWQMYWSPDGSTNNLFATGQSASGLKHVAFVRTGSTIELYLNGSSVASSSISDLYNNTTKELYISGDREGIERFQGVFTGVKIFDRALSSSELNELYDSSTQVITCYGDIDTSITDDCVYAPNLMTFNGRTEASALVDNSVSGITTTAFGSPTYEPTGTLIVSDGGVQYNTNFANLDGSTQSFNGGDIMDIGTSDFSMCGWFKSTSNVDQSLITKSNGNQSYQLFLASNGNIRQDIGYDGSNRWMIDGVGNFNDGEWHSYVVHVERSTPTYTFIVDGVTLSQSVLQSDGAISQNFNNAIDFIIGNVGYGGILFNGGMLLQGIAIGGDLTPYATEFHNGGVAKSYADMSQGFKDQFATGDIWRLGNFNGNSGNELIGLANGNVLTNTGSTPFGSEFAVECGEDKPLKVLFSSSTTSAEVRINSSDQIEVVSDAGTVFTFTTTLVASQQEVNIIQRNGNNLEAYNSIGTKQVLDVTGETFTLDRVSDTTTASDSDWQEISIYNNALTQDEVNYFYYLRNENNEILLPPLLPS